MNVWSKLVIWLALQKGSPMRVMEGEEEEEEEEEEEVVEEEEGESRG